VTGVIAAISHWRFHNVDRALVLNLAVPGCIGAVLGVTVLSSINGATLRPYLAMLLTIVGLRILVRFARPIGGGQGQRRVSDRRSIERFRSNQPGVRIAALLGGVTNGLIGAWGPVVTPYLLHRSVRPRYAIGCVNTAEVAVASASAFSLIASLGTAGVNGALLAAMLLGGVVAAPVAAWFIRYVPARPMGLAVAGLLLLTNARDLIAWAGIASGPWVWAIYGGIIAMVLIGFFLPRGRAHRPSPEAVASASRPADVVST
jgi:uncharacterized protein